MSAPGGGPVAAAAITDAALRLGLEDPIALANELTGVDVGALRDWSGLTSTVRQCLWDGAGRLGEAIPALSGGWSNPAPRQSAERHRQAGLAARDVLGRQIDTALDVIATLESSRVSAQAEIARAESRILATGWPPGQDLLLWAAGAGQLPAMAAAIGGLSDALRELRSRNDATLESLATALQVDPAEPVDRLAASLPSPPADPAASPNPIPGRRGSAGSANLDRINLDRLSADLQSSDVSVRYAAQGVQIALDRARAEGGQAQLLVYESATGTSQGRAAISVGDITRADNVVALAPGVSSAPASMSDGIGDALALRDRAEDLDPGERTAVISWYGYDAPLAVAGGGSPMTPDDALANVAAAGNDLYARAGGAQLVQDLKSFRAWAPDDARFIGVGFSMGSTTVSAAAARGAGFDDLVMLGSPGASVDVDSAADYPGLSPRHVWVASYDQDPITSAVTDELAGVLNGVGLNPLQRTPFGPDPADADFGAQVLDVTSNVQDPSVHLGGPFGWLVDGLTNDVVDLSAHHREDNYLSGASLDAVASIVVGRYDDVPLRPGR